MLKGLECEESSQLSLPAVLFHYFTFLTHNFKCFLACVVLSLALGVSVCTCVIVNVKIYTKGAPDAILLFYIHTLRPLTGGVPMGRDR